MCTLSLRDIPEILEVPICSSRGTHVEAMWKSTTGAVEIDGEAT